MEEIGGYFELELPSYDNFPQKRGIFLNSGRNAFEHILCTLDVKRIRIPYYTCDVILQPIKKLSIQYEFYNINTDFEIVKDFILKDEEYLLVTNYFGLKDQYISYLTSIYGNKLIIDNSQALYAKYIIGTNTFYSPRKYVGIPDGGIAYVPGHSLPPEYKKDFSYARCIHLLKRIDCGASVGYSDFKLNSKKLSNQNIKLMSNLTYKLINSIDFEKIKQKRIKNFNYIASVLDNSNKLTLPSQDQYECPMVYPYYTDDTNLRERLINHNIYVATYWPNVKNWCAPNSTEQYLVDNVVCIPIDQRYDTNQIQNIISLII